MNALNKIKANDMSFIISTLDVFYKVPTIKNREGRSRTLSIDIIQA